ncbi:MAG TPA: YaiO family outer membrane beta-barrel protein, partial [Candidatus Aquilonibacter sp.]
MIRLAAIAFAAALFFPGLSAAAACTQGDPVIHYVQVDGGTSGSSLTKGDIPWREQFLQAVVRDGNDHSVYLRAASDERFGATDPNYEGGVYDKLAPNVIANLLAGYSPTHANLPASVLGGGLDIRESDGYGLQAQYVERAYTAQNAGITTLGFDRYAGTGHIVLAFTTAVLSNVPGIALSERAGFDRTTACDQYNVAVAAGRDVESTGISNNVAVYKMYSYNAGDTHWMTPKLAWQL